MESADFPPTTPDAPAPPHVHQGNCCSHDHSDEIRIYRLSVREKLEACETFRRNALAYFAECQFSRAQQSFQKVIIYLDYTFPTEEEDETRCEYLRQSTMLNMCVCALKRGEYRETITLANQLLRDAGGGGEGERVKPLYLRGKARRELGEFELAREDLSLAKQLELARRGRAGELVRELEILAECEQRYSERSKEMAQGMFRADATATAVARSRQGVQGGSLNYHF